MGFASSIVTVITNTNWSFARLFLYSLPAWCVLRGFYSWRRLSHIPGPFWWSLSPFPLLRANLVGKSHQILNDLIIEYGTRTLLVLRHCTFTAPSTVRDYDNVELTQLTALFAQSVDLSAQDD